MPPAVAADEHERCRRSRCSPTSGCNGGFGVVLLAVESFSPAIDGGWPLHHADPAPPTTHPHRRREEFRTRAGPRRVGISLIVLGMLDNAALTPLARCAADADTWTVRTGFAVVAGAGVLAAVVIALLPARRPRQQRDHDRGEHARAGDDGEAGAHGPGVRAGRGDRGERRQRRRRRASRACIRPTPSAPRPARVPGKLPRRRRGLRRRAGPAARRRRRRRRRPPPRALRPRDARASRTAAASPTP